MSYTADTFVADEQPTAAKWNELWANDASFNDGTGIGDSVIGNRQLSAGKCVNFAYAQYTAFDSTTAVVPYDDTIPQSSEGKEFMSVDITPKAATNLLEISVSAFFVPQIQNNVIASLFRGSDTDCFAMAFYRNTGANAPAYSAFHGIIAAGTTSALTIHFRAGGQGAGTLDFNGDTGVRKFGASNKSSISVREYKA